MASKEKNHLTQNFEPKYDHLIYFLGVEVANGEVAGSMDCWVTLRAQLRLNTYQFVMASTHVVVSGL